MDPWWQNAFDQDGTLRKIILKKNLTNLKNIEIYSAADRDKAIEILQTLNESAEMQTVLVTPVFFSYIKNLQSSEKKINYIILNGFNEDADKKNNPTPFPGAELIKSFNLSPPVYVC